MATCVSRSSAARQAERLADAAARAAGPRSRAEGWVGRSGCRAAGSSGPGAEIPMPSGGVASGRRRTRRGWPAARRPAVRSTASRPASRSASGCACPPWTVPSGIDDGRAQVRAAQVQGKDRAAQGDGFIGRDVRAASRSAMFLRDRHPHAPHRAFRVARSSQRPDCIRRPPPLSPARRANDVPADAAGYASRAPPRVAGPSSAEPW